MLWFTIKEERRATLVFASECCVIVSTLFKRQLCKTCADVHPKYAHLEVLNDALKQFTNAHFEKLTKSPTKAGQTSVDRRESVLQLPLVNLRASQ